MKLLHAGIGAWVVALWFWPLTARAELPAFLRIENSKVREGNETLQKGDAKAALESYNAASRQLPDAPGVQLDRGLALLKQGDYAKAREALLSATNPNAPAELRADAYQDLALAYYREADGLSGKNDHNESQKLFREALDASKRSLRLRPGDANAAWNMELAARRIREEEQKQKDEDDKHKKDEKDKGKDQDKSDQKNQGDQNDPNAKSDPDKKPDDKPDQNQGDKNKDPDSNGQKDKPQADKPKEPEPKPAEPSDKKDQQKAPNDKAGQPDEAKKQGEALPSEAAQALDALEGGEENFERYRARQRASHERRAPDKDW
jgi:Ca-activated chloride channel family protein